MVSKPLHLRRSAAAAATFALALGGVLAVAQPAQALPFTVDSATDDGSGGTTLREAVEQANANPGPDTIAITVPGPITLTAPIAITGAVSISGLGSGATTITRGTDHALFVLDVADPAPIAERIVEFSGITLNGTNGTTSGRAISVDGDPVLGSLELTDVVVNGFDGATGASGIELMNVGSVTISDSAFVDNDDSDGAGGAIAATGVQFLTITDSTFEGNSSSFGGGAVYTFNVDETSITSSQFLDNSSTGSYGGAVSFSRSIGGAADVTVGDSTFSDNTAGAGGGAIASIDRIILSITGSGFTSNSAPRGGAVYVAGLAVEDTLDIESSTFTSNTATTLAGGAVAVGAVAASAHVTITTSAFLTNTTEGNGAVWIGTHGGYLTVDGSTFAGNITDADNSGLQVDDASLSNPTVIVQSTFEETGSAIGFGALGGVLQLRHSTVIGEIGLDAGNNTSDSAFISHSIIVGTGEFDVLNDGDEHPIEAYWSIFSQDWNANMTVDVEGNQYETDPALEPLGMNGGPTPTRLPSSWSPAIDAGDPDVSDASEFDQRGIGFPRVVNDRIDIGAVERPAATPAGPSLPPTGAEASPLLPIGAGLLLLLGAALVVARVRHSAARPLTD